MIALQNVGAGDGTVVDEWRKEEETYLRGLTKEPPHETLEMEYFGRLVALENCEYMFIPSGHTLFYILIQLLTDVFFLPQHRIGLIPPLRI